LDLEKNNVGDVGNPVQIDFSNCACVNAVKGGKPEAWDTMIDPTSGKTVLVMAVPVTAAPGQIDGILAGLMDLDDLTHQIARWKQGKNGFAFLVDETGKRIIYTGEGNSERQSEDPDALPLIKAFHKGQTGPIFFKDSHGVASIGQVIRTASGWEVATQMQKAEALADLNQAKTQYMFLLAAALIVGLLMALILGGLYTRPIRDLIGTANRISMGELTLTASTNRKDELADMAQAVTRMQESIRISVERMSRQRKSS
jgi:methyl-accepting chemotaxis protein